MLCTCRTDLRLIREQWQSFIGKAPPYPAETFHGKGIVILAGGLTYMVPAWVNIQMLRRTGRLFAAQEIYRSLPTYCCLLCTGNISMWRQAQFPLLLASCPLPLGPADSPESSSSPAGCSLPVEMFFPRKEYPTPPLEGALANLGVTCRQLPDVGSPSRREDPSDNARPEASLSGFTLKIAALILSQFEEVGFFSAAGGKSCKMENTPVEDLH